MITQEYLDDCIKSAQKNARRVERERIFKLLTSLGVMKDSPLGDHWMILHDSEGRIDITTRQLEGRSRDSNE
jgi:hypothetical protein